MIRVACATCGEFFEVGEELAGLPEFCPSCGALNDIPPIEIAEPEPELQAIVETAAIEPLTPAEPAIILPVIERGVPSGLWWTVIIGGPILFLAASLFLLSDNWESGHLQALSEAANRGDALMIDEDYAGAAAQYRLVVDTVGNRSIESVFIRELVDRSRRGETDAESRLRAIPAATAPAFVAATAPATQPVTDIHEALKAFERDSEVFEGFVHDRPYSFRDDQGNWRRGRFAVWDVTYEQEPQSDPPRIQLEYSCASRITEPRGDQNEAENDEGFVDDESPKILHIKTTFELRAGSWVILRHEVEAPADATPGLKARPSLDDFYDLERRAFGAKAGES